MHFSRQAQYLVKVECYFSWQAQHFVKFWEMVSAKRCIFPYPMRLQNGTSKVSEAAGARDFILGMWSECGRIVSLLAEAIQGFLTCALQVRISWQAQYLGVFMLKCIYIYIYHTRSVWVCKFVRLQHTYHPTSHSNKYIKKNKNNNTCKTSWWFQPI